MEVRDYIDKNLIMKRIDYSIKEETGLIFNEVFVLSQIVNSKNNRVSLSELKRDLGVSYSLLYKYLTKIQNKNLATKVIASKDRRKSEVIMNEAEVERSEEILLEVEMILESE